MDDKKAFSYGNAVKDGDRGWFVGQFVSPSLGLAHEKRLEIKWGKHAKGDRRRVFAKSLKATTISVLISGAFRVQLKLGGSIQEILLAIPGDYVAFGPEVDHTWEALESSLVITVRFPSLEDDQVEAERVATGT